MGAKFQFEIEKSKIYFIFIMFICSFFSEAAKAIVPTTSPGCLFGSVTIQKAEIPSFSKSALVFDYDGNSKGLDELNDTYKDIGTVHYLDENGTEIGEPHYTKSGIYKVFYYVKGDSNHNDLGSPESPISLTVIVKATSGGGFGGDQQEENNQVVDENGRTSVKINKNGIIWLQEESYGSKAWYGLDNTQGIFPLGSRFWVKWLHPVDNKEEFDKYFAQLDPKHQNSAEKDKLWIFLTGVTGPDGKEYSNFQASVPYYIQLGSDWDEQDIRALFISKGTDEILEAKFVSVEESKDFPESPSKYARLILNHFSPYAIYDENNLIDSTADTENNYKNNYEIDKQPDSFNATANYYINDNEISEDLKHDFEDTSSNKPNEMDSNANVESPKNSSSIKTGNNDLYYLILQLEVSLILICILRKKYSYLFKRNVSN